MPLSLNPIQRCNDTLWPATWKGRHSTFHLLDQFRRGQGALLLVGALVTVLARIERNLAKTSGLAYEREATE